MIPDRWEWVETAFRTPGLRLAGNPSSARREAATCWETGHGKGADAFLAESRTDDGVQYLGISDNGLAQLCDMLAEREGRGVRWIWTDTFAMCDHLLPECPAVRRKPGTARWGNGLVDPLGSDLCGWCVRVWKARNPEAVAS